MGDNLRPLTLLLGATCLWALCVLVLALAGLGARFAPPSETARAPALPKITLSRSQSRLGPITDYLEVGQRPLLTSDRRPGAQPADGSEGTAELDVALTSVLMTPRLQLAIFTDNKDASSRRVRVGEVVPGTNWRLVSLEARRAVMEGPSGQRELPLRVFDGKGGQPPTPATLRPANEVRPDAAPPADATPSLPPPPPVTSRPQPVEQPAAQDATPEQSATAPLTQEQQVEAIRRRIEARRAQMRAEAAAAGAQEK